jgi:hypothetical protein
MMIGLSAVLALVGIAVIGQDVAYFFLGHEGVTTRFVRRYTPSRRVRRIACDRIRVTTERASS